MDVVSVIPSFNFCVPSDLIFFLGMVSTVLVLAMKSIMNLLVRLSEYQRLE